MPYHIECSPDNEQYLAGYELGEESGIKDAKKHKEFRKDLSRKDAYEITALKIERTRSYNKHHSN